MNPGAVGENAATAAADADAPSGDTSGTRTGDTSGTRMDDTRTDDTSGTRSRGSASEHTAVARFQPWAVCAALAVDAAIVIAFAAAGRSSHAREASLAGLAETAWPFLVGLAISWVVARVHRRPFAVWPSGITVWVGTVVAGMIVRSLVGQGTALAFVLVAAGTLGVGLVGWRLVAALVPRLRR